LCNRKEHDITVDEHDAIVDCPGPNIGSEVGPYLPFANVFRFLDVQRPCAVYAIPWGERGSLV